MRAFPPNTSDQVIALRRQLKVAFPKTRPNHYSQLLPYDQNHYHGTAAVDDVIAKV